MQFIAEKANSYYRVGFYDKYYNAIPATIYLATLRFIKNELYHYLLNTMAPDTTISLLDIHNNLLVLKYLPKTNKLLFGVILDEAGNQFKLNEIDATHVRRILEL